GIDARGKHDRQMSICQIKRLQDSMELVIRKRGETGSVSGAKMPAGKIPFYIDAICFPRDPAIKTQALQQMKVIYRKAEAVIVWDRDLLQREQPAEALDANILLQIGD